MAGFNPIAGDLIQIRVACMTVSQLSLNVLHYQVFSLGGAGLTLQGIANAFDASVAANYKACMAPGATYRGVAVQNLMLPRTLEFVSTGNSGVGTAGTDLAPTQVSFLISTKGALAGRRFLGRIYVGFPSTSYVAAGGGMTAGGLTQITALAALLGPVITLTSGANSVVLNLAIRNPDVSIPAPHTPVWNTVLTITPASIWATQKRRGQYGRTNQAPF